MGCRRMTVVFLCAALGNKRLSILSLADLPVHNKCVENENTDKI